MKIYFHVIMGTLLAKVVSLCAFSTEAPFSPNNDWEPFIAADRKPGSAWVYRVAAQQSSQIERRRIVLQASPDGGLTWNPLVHVCDKDNYKGDEADPTIQVANTGTVYVCLLQEAHAGPVVSKSFDNGKTFTTPVVVRPGKKSWTDKPWMAINPDGSEVYVAWYGKNDHFISTSLNGGKSFNTPVSQSSYGLYWFTEGGAVSPKTGTVFFSTSGEDPSGKGPVALAIYRSDDKGTSWSIPMLIFSEQAPGCMTKDCHDDEFQASTSIAVDSAGTILFVYSATQNSGMAKSLYAFTSKDDGYSWEGPFEIYSAPSNSPVGDGGFPAVAAGAKPGEFGVIWQDNRNGLSAWNTYFRSTHDGGKTWSTETRLSNRGADPKYSYKGNEGYLFPYGDYTGLTSNSSGNYFAFWGEGVGRETQGGCWYSFGH